MEKEKKEKIDWKKMVDEAKAEFERAVEFLKSELTKIRGTRASPALIENLQVEIFGQKFLLKQLGTISIPQAREIVIEPWDGSYIEGIVKAIENSDLSLSPIVDQNKIRIALPPITQEYKDQLIKLISQKKEITKKRMREERERVWRKIREAFTQKQISEDDKYKAKEKLQDLLKEYQEKIDQIVSKKISEI